MILLSLVQNISLVVVVAVVYHYAERKFRPGSWPHRLLNGLFFGFAAMLAMSSPLRFEQGIIYDSRTIILGIAGTFGGPWIALIATLISILYRVMIIGGEGMYAGSLSILSASLIGVGAYFFRKSRPRWKSSLPRFWLIGLAIHIAMLLSQLLLPSVRWASVLSSISMPVLIFYPIGYTLIAALFLESEERGENIRRLRASEERYRRLFHNHHTTMLLVDPSTEKIIDANPAAETFYGWPRDSLLSMTVKDLNTLPGEELSLRIRMAKENESNLFHFKHRTASGDVRDVAVYTGPVEFQGTVVLFSLIHDETARIKAEEEVLALNKNLEDSYEAIIEGWSAAMDLWDEDTEGHSQRVAKWAADFGERLGLSEREIVKIRRGALLHDLGKMAVPESVLKKSGPLDEDEWALMKEHPKKSLEMLSKIPSLKDSLDIPLYHHEKYDGSGYPFGKRGEEIPLAARLFSIIDVFDALTSDRPYRRAWTRERAIAYLKEQRGIQFDPHLVDVFVAMIE
ncbi:MAG: HD domain-containing protein [Spirochaetia bacterium]|nr:HD domain-containing protein [Spirochaetia bacterium]VBB40467.1 membrane hypothetical protein [uncultured Spirochaetota bacterium]